MLDQILNTLVAYWKEARSRRQLRSLLEQDDRMLRDIGVTREDVMIALNRPYDITARDEARRLSRATFRMDRAI